MPPKKFYAKCRRRRSQVTQQMLVFERYLEAADSRKVIDAKLLIDPELEANWYLQKASPSKDRYVFELPGQGIQTRSCQNLISEDGLKDVSNELHEADEYSMIVEDIFGNPVAQPRKDRVYKSIFAQSDNASPKPKIFKPILEESDDILPEYSLSKNSFAPTRVNRSSTSSRPFNDNIPAFAEAGANSVMKFFADDSLLDNQKAAIHDDTSAERENASQYESEGAKTAMNFFVDDSLLNNQKTAIDNRTGYTSIRRENTSQHVSERASAVMKFFADDSLLNNQKTAIHNDTSAERENASQCESEGAKTAMNLFVDDSLLNNQKTAIDNRTGYTSIRRENTSQHVSERASAVMKFFADDSLLDNQKTAIHDDTSAERENASQYESEGAKTAMNFFVDDSLLNNEKTAIDNRTGYTSIRQENTSQHVSERASTVMKFFSDDSLLTAKPVFGDVDHSGMGSKSIDVLAEEDKENVDAEITDSTIASNVSCSSFIVRVVDGCKSFYLKDFRGEDTELNKLIFVCGQATIQPWNALMSKLKGGLISKIGEGSFGEVYKALYMDVDVALKIFPFKESSTGNYPFVNGGEMVNAGCITTELVVTKALSSLSLEGLNMTPNFIELKKTFVISGKYPAALTEAWEKFSKEKESENSHPSEYSSSSRHFIAMTLGLGGRDLEHFQIKSEKKALSVFCQVALSLAVAEVELQFEHRDLHWGNILVKEINDKDPMQYRLKGKKYLLKHCNVSVNIIDFTLSRISKENTIVFAALGDDPGLFEQEGDKQFDVYREMNALLSDKWDEFCPKTNCLWLEYLADKLLYGVKGIMIPKGISNARKAELWTIFERVRNYDSTCAFVDSVDFAMLSAGYLSVE